MRAGRLRHRVTIERAIETRDANGGIVQTWDAWITTWASVEPITGREYFIGKQVSAETSHAVVTRYFGKVQAKMRVLWGSRVLEIEQVLNIKERNTDMKLMCKEVIE